MSFLDNRCSWPSKKRCCDPRLKDFDFLNNDLSFLDSHVCDLHFGIKIRASMSDEFDGLDATEKAGIEAMLIRSRVLAVKIANELRNKRPEHFVDKLSLADVHASLERAADVLRTVKGSRKPRGGRISMARKWG